MPVLFDNIPANVRVPFFYAEFRSGGTPAYTNSRLLLIGQKLSAGSATAGVPILVREGQAVGLFGAGSHLAQMDAVARKNAPLQEIWALPLDDHGSGVAATRTITVGGSAASEAQVWNVYICGRQVRLRVLTSDANNTIATNLAAAINAISDLPVTAAASSAVVTLTAKNKGTLGNAIEVDLGVLSEEGPASRARLTIGAVPTNGASDPTIATALAALGDDEFDWIVMPYTDSTNLSAMTDWMSDVSGQWSWIKQLYGHCFTVRTDSVASMQTFGLAQNRQHFSYFPARKFRSGPWEVVAAVGARAAKHLSNPPELSRPLQTLELVGIMGPLEKADQLTKSDRQTLYYSGISGYYVHRDGSVRLDRVLTGYRVNAWGDADATYLDVETMGQSQWGIRYIRGRITSKHGRQALADSNPGGLPHITTAADLRASFIHAYADCVALGVFEGLTTFARDIVVERDSIDPNRINASLPLDHVNQLRIVAVSAVNYMQRREPREALPAFSVAA